MLNNKIVNIIAVSCLLLLLAADKILAWNISFWLYGLPLLIFLPFTIHGAININSGFFVKALCEADTEEKVVALSFDDGPLPEYTPAVLDILKQAQVPAAFFV